MKNAADQNVDNQNTTNQKPQDYDAVKIKNYVPKRECGDCDMCCRWLHYSIDGKEKMPGNPCFYLGKGCTIHPIRPQLCRDYFCAYLRGIVPEWFKPNLSKVLISVERWGPKNEHEMLRVIECGQKIGSEYLHLLFHYCVQNNIGMMYQVNGSWFYFGNEEFMNYWKERNKNFNNLNNLQINQLNEGQES